MKRTKISAIYADASAFTSEEITVCGWARTIRDMKNFAFVELNDGSAHKSLQVVFEKNTLSNYDEIARQNVGAALIVKGLLSLTPEAKQPFELKAASIEVEGVSSPEYPLQKKRHSLEYLRTIAHLRPRTNLFSAVFRVRSVAAGAIHEFFQQQGFVYVHTPIITGSDCEGAGEMFRVTTLDVNSLRAQRTARLTTRRISSARKQTSRFPVSSTLKTLPWLSVMSIPLAQPSAPRIPIQRATPLNSG